MKKSIRGIVPGFVLLGGLAIVICILIGLLQFSWFLWIVWWINILLYSEELYSLYKK